MASFLLVFHNTRLQYSHSFHLSRLHITVSPPFLSCDDTLRNSYSLSISSIIVPFNTACSGLISVPIFLTIQNSKYSLPLFDLNHENVCLGSYFPFLLLRRL